MENAGFAVNGISYTAKDLNDIAAMFDRLAANETQQATVTVATEKGRSNHKGAARAYTDAANILRNTRLQPVVNVKDIPSSCFGNGKG